MNQTLLFSQNPNFLTAKKIFKRSSTSSSSSSSSTWKPRNRITVVKCSNNGESNETGGGNMNEALSGLVAEQVEELLKKKENKNLFDELEKATLRVETAKMELGEIEKQEIETKRTKDHIEHLEKQAFQIEESQREIAEAKAMLEEAKQSLLVENADSLLEAKGFDDEKVVVDEDEERIESVKAALIAGIVGTIAGLPIEFTQAHTVPELILPVVVTFISCALFGVTFRYAVRRDLDNFQLKTGVCAAFGFVKGLGTLQGGLPVELETASLLSHAFEGVVNVSESVFIFLFAAVSLDFCFKMRILSPFPKRKVGR